MATHSQAWPNDGVAIEEWTTPTYCPGCGILVFRANAPMRPVLRGKNGGRHRCNPRRLIQATTPEGGGR